MNTNELNAIRRIIAEQLFDVYKRKFPVLQEYGWENNNDGCDIDTFINLFRFQNDVLAAYFVYFHPDDVTIKDIVVEQVILNGDGTYSTFPNLA